MQLPEIPGVQAAVDFRPARASGHVVGGNSYDLFAVRATAPGAVVVGDVAGKGAQAAAVTGLARCALRAAAMQESSPSRVLELFNEAIPPTASDEFCSVTSRRSSRTARGARRRARRGRPPAADGARADGIVEQVGLRGSFSARVPIPS